MSASPTWPGPGGSMLPYYVPLVDHPHERHPSMSWGMVRGHRRPEPFYPDVDLHDTGTGYVMEVELPGLTDPAAAKVEWSSLRDIHVSGTLARPKTSGEHATPADGSDNVHDPTLLVGERKVGAFHRHFHLPFEVDVKNLHAKLEYGLLTIRVDKVKHEEKNMGKAAIEHAGR